jgi:hypothetical protein
MVGYTLKALQIAMLNPVFHPPKGLFETQHKVGMIFSIVKELSGLKLINSPVENSEEGELHACEIMDASNFVCWAIDPWTSEINIEMKE